MLDKTYEVLMEGPSKTNPDQVSGRTRGNEVVVVKGGQDLAGKLIKVRMVTANSWTLFGEIN